MFFSEKKTRPPPSSPSSKLFSHVRVALCAHGARTNVCIRTCVRALTCVFRACVRALTCVFRTCVRALTCVFRTYVHFAHACVFRTYVRSVHALACVQFSHIRAFFHMRAISCFARRCVYFSHAIIFALACIFYFCTYVQLLSFCKYMYLYANIFIHVCL